ncbi:MAG TPA: beta keto-acyl synthase [Blastocatellia bacterium]|nr:beta keto-acyl synthase [Blastocatellia bacterium]
MTASIAIVGMACVYPDARTPGELWQNVLSQRRAFRRMPDERLRLADYLSTDRTATDSFYSADVAVIEGYEFDRLRFRVAGTTFRSADLAHWLALDVAAQTINDAGFNSGEGLPRESTGVFLGNTLTGEFSRANTLRLRWPYVRRIIEANLLDEDWSIERRNDFLKRVEATYKDPFPAVGDETLAGGLSNTIAGRICNHFDLKGGGYTLDGACASSLLAVANACSALSAGDLDAALAGGVDLSLDPFELVGFAKVGALAADEMRVYDSRSNGFWPGEGCGFVLLTRLEDALAQHLRIYAIIRGWGISSDGHGGITRPEIEGQLLALRRAYDRAGFGIETVAYFEGHGTGTSVGDSVELKAISSARRLAKDQTPAAAIGSIKANIGHTKAAAGVAGLIKSVLALNAGIVPPTTGCEQPHPEFRDKRPALRSLKTGEPWPEDQALRAGVSAMGFGGINAHVVMEALEPVARPTINSFSQSLVSTFQDGELFLLGAQSLDELRGKVDHLLSFAARVSRAELSDLAAHLEATLNNYVVRAAVVASTPTDLAGRLGKLRTVIAAETTEINAKDGVFFSARTSKPRIGFLFPGQGSPSHLSGGALRRRFGFVEEIYAQANLSEDKDETATAIAQPAIVTASIAGLRILDQLHIKSEIAVGHSLGELTAFFWAGAIDEECLLRIARVRGQSMTESSISTGAMASIGAGEQEVLTLLNGERICVAGLNSPTQTVISGDASAVEHVLVRARAKKLSAIRLPVSHAFHSSLVAGVAPVLRAHLASEQLMPLQRSIVSTITGNRLLPETDLTELLCQQITSPVRFMEAVSRSDSAVDLWIEVGPGEVLRGIMSEITETPVVSLDAGSDSLCGLLSAAAAAFVLGRSINHHAMFEGRFTKPFNLDWRPKFFINPCELAPVPATLARSQVEEETNQHIDTVIEQEPNLVAISNAPFTSALELVIQLVSERAELPASAVEAESRLLSDLHLNSISVGQLVAEAARQLHLPRPISPTDFADARVSEVAQAFEEQLALGAQSQGKPVDTLPAGIDSWVRAFRIELVERALSRRLPPNSAGCWQVLGSPDDPFVESLRKEFTDCEAGKGIVVCLQPGPDEAIVARLLEGARLVLAEKESPRFVLVQRGVSAAAFARTLHLEAPRVTTCVLSVPQSHTNAAEWVIAEALAAQGYVEAIYDDDGRRFEPVVGPLPFLDQSDDLPLSATDVLVVTGGGKGITSECALALAKESKARLVLIGRAHPDSDEELSSNLKRMTAAGTDFRYLSADVTDAAQMRELIETVEKDFGPVTGILHGAARNVPQLLSNLDQEAFRETLAVKVEGARNLLAAVNPEKLKLLITFGSIIARTGLPGEAHYGLANELLTRLTEEWKSTHPACRCLAVEWSIWSGKGMGGRLGDTDRLMQQGITPISPDDGVNMLRKLLGQPNAPVSVVVMSRFSDLPTFKIDRPELPFLRFLEEPKVFYPQIELVVDAELSSSTDPYLKDHVFQGEMILPAVMGLEAMAQAAMALIGATQVPTFEGVNFSQAVVVPTTKPLKIRLAALVRAPGIVEVALRSEATAFQVNHFQATCCFDEQEFLQGCSDPIPSSRIALDPRDDLYGNILFQQGRFRRLSNYRVLRARECVAEITPDGNGDWFNRYLPSQLVLGDPGARDAALHAIQACIPHATILPVGIDRLRVKTATTTSNAPLFARATEVSRNGNLFTYNLDVVDDSGRISERWDGLQLQAVAAQSVRGPWVESLLGPYIERRIEELVPGASISVALLRSLGTDRRARSNRAIQMALDEKVEVLRRPDGKPEVNGGRAVSASHSGDFTLAVAGSAQLSCDLETVIDRPPSDWVDLLGQDGYKLAKFSSRTIKEDEVVSATRAWTANECLKKIGAMAPAPLVCLASPDDEWILFSSGYLIIASYVTHMRERDDKLALAVLVNRP